MPCSSIWGAGAGGFIWQDMFLGETMLVNGKVWPRHDVKQGKYRLRMLNGCNSRTLALQFCSGANTVPCPSPLPFQLLGQEGGLLPAPVPLTEVTLGDAERADVIVDFASLAGGTSVYLQNTAPAPFPGTCGRAPVPPPAHEQGWKDTVQVGPNEIVRVIARFDDYEGLFP